MGNVMSKIVETIRILNSFIKVDKTKIALSNGQEIIRDVIRCKPVVAVLPIFSNGDIILVKQYRPGPDTEIWEIPSGIVECDEDFCHAARRECEEETGYKIGTTLIRLFEGHTTPGISDEIVTIYVGFDLEIGRKQPDFDEFITSKRFSPSEINNMIETGQILDFKTILALMIYERNYF